MTDENNNAARVMKMWWLIYSHWNEKQVLAWQYW
jgi:hypothetical protein